MMSSINISLRMVFVCSDKRGCSVRGNFSCNQKPSGKAARFIKSIFLVWSRSEISSFKRFLRANCKKLTISLITHKKIYKLSVELIRWKIREIVNGKIKSKFPFYCDVRVPSLSSNYKES